LRHYNITLIAAFEQHPSQQAGEPNDSPGCLII